jgi:hypothetical protein
MHIIAHISSEWRKRMLVLFCMYSGIALWFMSDGYYFWPREQGRYEVYSQLLAELKSTGKAEDAESSAFKLEWQRMAQAAGYKNKAPKERTPDAIHEQRLIGWVTLIGSLVFAAWIAWNHTRKVSLVDGFIIDPKGCSVPLNAIKSIDKKHWKNKGIAYGIYSVEARTQRICLDAHKFDGCHQIITEIEQTIAQTMPPKSLRQTCLAE